MYKIESIKHALWTVFVMISDNKNNVIETEFKNIQESLDYINALNKFVRV